MEHDDGSAGIGSMVGSLFRGGRKLFWVAAVLSLSLDQWTKFAFAIVDPTFGTHREVIPGALWFVKQTPNTRGVFGIGPQAPFFYAIAALVGLLLILYFLLHTPKDRLWPICALGLIAGGAVGNLVDRLAYGAVRDFIRMIYWPFAYNVADAAICIGVAVLMVDVFFAEEEGEGAASEAGQQAEG